MLPAFRRKEVSKQKSGASISFFSYTKTSPYFQYLLSATHNVPGRPKNIRLNGACFHSTEFLYFTKLCGLGDIAVL
jgi:hypothetical protein